MPKDKKVGLHKEVSSIFDGVPLPEDSDTQRQQYRMPASEPSDCKEQPKYDSEHLETPAAQQPTAPSSTTAPTPEPQKPSPAVPRTAPAKQPKAGIAIKSTSQTAWQQIKGKLFAPKPGVNTARQKTMAVLVPALSIVFVFVVIQVLSGPSRSRAMPRGIEPAGALAAAGAVGKDSVDWQRPAPYPTELRDPTQFGFVKTAQAAQAEISRVTVRGIVYSEDRPSAVIGTQIVHEGEEVMGATVIKINKDSVEFEMNGKRWTQKVQR